MIIASIDTGFADLALAAWDVQCNRTEPWLIETVRLSTKKETAKRKTHVGTDDGRRIDELADALGSVFGRLRPVVIGYELPAASKGARAGHALGMAHAIARLAARAYSRDIALVEVTVLDARRAAVGRTTGTPPEQEVHAMLIARFDRPGLGLQKASKHEMDAIAVGLATMDSSVVRALLATSRAPAARHLIAQPDPSWGPPGAEVTAHHTGKTITPRSEGYAGRIAGLVPGEPQR